ncbi:hypothetical protein LCGC14_2543830 [marine sediment metagenome]|uniref:Uncharacterized protein n=1 Tax=marine sediment metagenome TaxID=412755 RepID=A0A0F9BCQ7_9ZZZZ
MMSEIRPKAGSQKGVRQMTKKDYIKLAELIKDKSTGNDAHIFVDDLLEGLCAILQDDNPRFDRERFIEACQ